MKDLFEKYYSGEMSSIEELNLINRIASDKEFEKEYIRYKNMRSLLHLLPLEADNQIGNKGYGRFERKRKQKEINRSLFKFLRYAAAVAILVGVTSIFNFFYFRSTNNVLQEDNLNELFVPAGQRARVTLDDGTVVWLNSNSSLLYPSTFDKGRSVKLTGEAFFEVVTDPQKPFNVFADNLIVTALGTTFNVSNYPDSNIQVALFEGSVKVINQLGGDTNFLKPNQILTKEKEKIWVDTIKQQKNFLWKDGIYSFENEPLYSIIKKLERYYDAKIEIKDQTISEYKYTGKFRQLDGVETILSEFQKSYSFSIEKNGNKYVLSK